MTQHNKFWAWLLGNYPINPLEEIHRNLPQVPMPDYNQAKAEQKEIKQELQAKADPDCRYCEGRGVEYVPSGTDDVAPENCRCTYGK